MQLKTWVLQLQLRGYKGKEFTAELDNQKQIIIAIEQKDAIIEAHILEVERTDAEHKAEQQRLMLDRNVEREM